MAPAHVSLAALKVDDMWRRVRTASECYLDAAGKHWRVWTREVVESYLERLRWSGSPSGRVVAGSASDNTGGSDTIQTYLRRSSAVPLSHHVHFAAVAQAKVLSFHQCTICRCSNFVQVVVDLSVKFVIESDKRNSASSSAYLTIPSCVVRFYHFNVYPFCSSFPTCPSLTRSFEFSTY
jgi:hypothetical protein